MASLVRGLSPLLRSTARRPARSSGSSSSSICLQCLHMRSFSSSAVLLSGHNKWSKIKHEKGAADRKRAKVIGDWVKRVILYSKLYGADPNLNPELATTLARAKQAGVPKAKLDDAIARGQGKSTKGGILKSFTFEAIIPPSVAVIVEAETENTARLVQELARAAKRHKATPSGAKFLFNRMGHVVFEKSEDKKTGWEEVWDRAVEVGAEDVYDDEDGNITVWTQPNLTSQMCDAVVKSHGLKVLSSDILWVPQEDMEVKLSKDEDLKNFIDFLAALREEQDVQAIYSNVSRGDMSDEDWAAIDDNLDK